MPDEPRSTSVKRVPVHKVINNNVVVWIDESGRERVLMGRGLGFQLKPADRINLAKVEKTFILDEGEAGERELRLLGDVPYPVIESVTRATDAAERSLGRALGRGFALAVLDHLQFVLERLEKGVRIPATSMPELRVLYPAEYAAATEMTASIAPSPRLARARWRGVATRGIRDAPRRVSRPLAGDGGARTGTSG